MRSVAGGCLEVVAVKLDEAIRRYLDDLRLAGLAKATQGSSRRDLETFVIFLRLTKREWIEIESLTQAEVLEYFRFMQTHPSLKTGRPLEKRCLVDRVYRLRHLFRFLKREGIISKNLGNAVALYCMELTNPAYLTPQEVTTYLEGPNTQTPIGLRDRAILEIGYGCGLRWRELSDLAFDDFNASTDELRIKRGDLMGHMKRHEMIARTWPRALPVPSIARHWLMRYLNEVRPRIIEEKVGHLDLVTDALFLDFLKAGPLCRGSIYAIYEKGRKRTKIEKDAACANIRDSLTKHLIDAGADHDAVWWFLGLEEAPDEKTSREYARIVLARHPRHKSSDRKDESR